MATKIIKSWINGEVQEVEIEDIVTAEDELSVEDRLASLEDKPVITKGNLLVGNGTEDCVEMTPAEVLSHINGASISTLTTEEYDALVEAEQTNANVLYMLTDADEEEYALKSDLDNYALTSDIPTKVSELKNDSGYLTEHQSLADYAKTEDLATVATSGSYNDLADTPTIPTVPTKISAFTNDKGYLTAVPSEYITEEELSNKKYLSEVNPEDVLFDYNLIITQPVGRITKDVLNYNNGNVTLMTTNKNLKEVFIDLFGGELQPNVSSPTYSFYTTGNQAGEVGETFTLPTATFKVTSVGSYSYNDTGVKFSGSITDGDNTVTFTDLETGGYATVQTTGENVFTEGTTTFNFSGTYSYNEGNTPLTNLGEESTEVSAIPAVTDKSISTSCTYTGYRKIFAFSWNDTSTNFLSDIRGQGESTNGAWEYAYPDGQVVDIDVYTGARQVVVAFPSTYEKRPKIYYKAAGDDAAVSLVLPTNTYPNNEDESKVTVADPNGENPIEYTVYTVVGAVDFPSTTPFKFVFE